MERLKQADVAALLFLEIREGRNKAQSVRGEREQLVHG